MGTVQLVLYIIETALAILKSKVTGSKAYFDTPEALARIVGAGLEAYRKEVGQPLDVWKIRPFEHLGDT